MRVLVIVLALLAAAKIGLQEYLTATAKSEIIVAAYRDRAIAACEQAARAKRVDVKPAWATGSSVRLLIGKGSLDVPFWQVDHALWQARYKNPYLLFAMGAAPQPVFCEFDIVQGSASVLRM